MSSVISISDAEFEQEVLQAPQTVLVYFWAAWCGPCRLMSPLMDGLTQTFGDRLKVVKMEIDPNPNAVAEYKVEGVPALRLFQNGKMVDSIEGAISKAKLESLVEACLSKGVST